MNNLEQVGQIEKATQERVINFFQAVLWYNYLWNWEKEERKSPIENDLLKSNLTKRWYSEKIIDKAIYELEKIALNQTKSLYDINKEVYSMLRYWIKVKEDVGENNITVWLIDWKNIDNNHFAVAEELTYKWHNTKRPDIVIYINGIALWVIELKRSKVWVSEWIRQNLDNQKEIFIKSFFSTIQFVMAWNDTEWLKYWCIETPEKYYLSWKEESDIANILDRSISQICDKNRFLELIHDFIVYDWWIKKLCRPHQYFWVKASQKVLQNNEGWIIWHTQWSWKSLTMVWLTKWIKENITDSRILVITDREELDDQIKRVYEWVNENIYRTKSSRDLVNVLNKKEESIICSLIHKFWNKTKSDDELFAEELKNLLPKDFEAKWNIYVFVDECHRTNSWKLHNAMKILLPKAIFIWFTWTPLLKIDKLTSLETFGKYIHTYKFDEAVKDKVVLDLRYEARYIDQNITSQDKIDLWFENKTKWLTDYAKMQIKKKWWTVQNVLSSKWRLEQIVKDILFDFELKDRLSDGSWNAMLVAGSIYEACKYYELFISSWFTKCAVISSYNPWVSSIKWETTGWDEQTENIEKNNTYRKMLASWFNVSEDEAIKKIDDFENEIKKKFIKEPWQMKLLIVVDKLLTWFDAPSATYLYIDKSMRDHGLFQAITRVNRLDWDSKEYWYIIDYKDLFWRVEKSLTEYTSWAFDNFEKEDVSWLLTDRLEKARERLDESLETIAMLCEWVWASKTTTDFMHYFIWQNANNDESKLNEQKRHNLYKYSVSLIRSYANIANEMIEAWYTKEQSEAIKSRVKYYTNIRDEIRIASGDYVDMKVIEAGMRHLIDSYISADESKIISTFDNTTLLDLIISNTDNFQEKLPENIKKDQEAMGETIENNIRKLIVDESEFNPKYFERMSKLLDEIIQSRKQQAIEYAEYLKKVVDLINKVKNPFTSPWTPKVINTPAKKAIYDNFWENEEFTIALYNAIQESKQDDFRANKMRQRMILNSIKQIVNKYWYDEYKVDDIMEMVVNFRQEF